MCVSLTGFAVHSLAALRATFEGAERNSHPRAEPVGWFDGAKVQFITFADRESKLVCVSQDGTTRVFATDALSGQIAAPQAIAAPVASQQVHSVTPNPDEHGELCVVVLGSGQKQTGGTAYMLNIHSGAWQPLVENVTAADWSTRGKQFVLGLKSGEIVQLAPTGEGKGRIPTLPDAGRDIYVDDLRWIENHVFLVT